MKDTRVVFVMGARQVGKSTLTRSVAANECPAAVLSFDDDATRRAAEADPAGFVAALDHPVLLDEVQRVPEVLLAIKDDVDRNAEPGRYLLTGSANVLSTRKVKDALTGRVDRISLWPLAQSEVRKGKGNIVDDLFAGLGPQIRGAPIGRDAFAEMLTLGGYPEARLRRPDRRDRWFSNYIDTVLDRDLRDVSDARRLDEMPRLLALLATQAANVLNTAVLARKLGIDKKTVAAYVRLLETVFLVRTLKAWRPGLAARETSRPKSYVVDSGLLAHLLGADERRVRDDDQVTGKMLENFVAMEVLRLAEWSSVTPRLFHYRQRDEEIDLVLESRSGDIACIEVKSGASLREGDWRALRKLRDGRSAKFKAGIVIYTGEQTVPLGDRLWAVPLSCLWQ